MTRRGARGRRVAAAAEREPAAARAPASPSVDPAQAWIDRAKAAGAEREPDASGQAGRLVRKYSPLERDQALLEVQTDKGFFEVILGRDGSMTVFHPEER